MGVGERIPDIAAVDLWANGSSSVYYDDLLLEPVAISPPPCPADVYGDGMVDVSDLLAVIAAWGTPGVNVEDINDDGIVDIDDVFEVLVNWGPCQ